MQLDYVRPDFWFWYVVSFFHGLQKELQNYGSHCLRSPAAIEIKPKEITPVTKIVIATPTTAIPPITQPTAIGLCAAGLLVLVCGKFLPWFAKGIAKLWQSLFKKSGCHRNKT